MKNPGLKLISLLLAVVVWSVVSAPRRGKAIERAFSASVALVGMPRDYVIITPTTVPEKVSLRLRGRKADLDALTSRALEGTCDLSWIQKSGEATILLRSQHFNVPAEVEVVSIDPNKFQFRVEEIRERAVRIRPVLVGEPADGYRVGQLAVEPGHARVEGPARQIVAMEEVGTERIIMSGRTDTFVQNVAIVTDSPLVRVISPITAAVTVPVVSDIGPVLPTDTGTTGEGQPEAETAEDRRTP